ERAIDADRYAGEQVTKGALQRETENDGDDPRGGDHSGYRHAESEIQDGDQRSEINDGRREVRREPRRMMLMIDSERDLSGGDRRSRDEKPPQRDEQLFRKYDGSVVSGEMRVDRGSDEVRQR